MDFEQFISLFPHADLSKYSYGYKYDMYGFETRTIYFAPITVPDGRSFWERQECVDSLNLPKKYYRMWQNLQKGKKFKFLEQWKKVPPDERYLPTDEYDLTPGQSIAMYVGLGLTALVIGMMEE